MGITLAGKSRLPGWGSRHATWVDPWSHVAFSLSLSVFNKSSLLLIWLPLQLSSWVRVNLNCMASPLPLGPADFADKSLGCSAGCCSHLPGHVCRPRQPAGLPA